ncbi:MAG: gamma-glutamyltransferase [Polyangiaceae bacterium]
MRSPLLQLTVCSLAAVVACGSATGPSDHPHGSASAPASASEVKPHVVPDEARALKDDLYAVAAENETAVATARTVLERGGSAVDAAVAGVLVGCAAHAASCSIGGGGAAMLWDASTKSATFLDFREVAPSGVSPGDYVSKNPSRDQRGLLVGVPGLIAGLYEMHRRGGKLAWSDVVKIAAADVAKGFPLSPYMAQAVEWSASWAYKDPSARSVAPSDAKNRIGDTIENAPLARLLESIAEQGPDAVYKGPVASQIVQAARAFDSPIKLGDLAAYAPVAREPIQLAYGDKTVVLAPPPSGAGFNIAQLLTMFTSDDLVKLDPGSGRYVHALSEGLRSSYADRARFIGDPAFTRADMSQLLDPSSLRTRRAQFPEDSTTMPHLRSVSEFGTFHISVVDGLGNVVACTASVGSVFGAQIVTESGFVLNDALSDFAFDDYAEKLVTRGPNFVRGGARPTSNAAPTLVLSEGAPILALGGSGGLRAASGVAEVLFHILAEGASLPDAITAARFHVTATGALKLEPELASIAADVTARGEAVEVKPYSFSAVTGVAIRRVDKARVLEPVFDPRKGGAVTVGHSEAPIDNATEDVVHP